MRDGRCARYVWAGMMLGLALILAACGQAAADPNAGVSSNGQGQQMNSPEAPGDPNTSVSGQPGQPGAPATGAAVTGRVTDAAGQPVVGVLVLPQSTDSPPIAIPEIAVLTNEQGEYQWSLPPGRYTLSFTAEGYAPTTAEVIVVSGRSAKLDATLQKP